MWVDQFEFAGFYMAKEKGFYEKIGLDVEIKKYNLSTKKEEVIKCALILLENMIIF